MLTLEDKLQAVDLVHNGMSYRQAAKACGIAHSSIWKWDRCLKGDASDLYALVAGKRREDGLMDLENLPDDPDELKRIIYDMQFEMDLRDEVAKILKKDPGVHLRSLKNKEKALLVDALAKRKTYSIGWMLSCIGLAPATFYYHRKRIGKDPERGLRAKVMEVGAAHPEFGYRRVKHALIDEGASFAHASEKRIRRVMAEEGIQPSRRRKSSRYSSYDARLDTDKALPNIPLKEDGTHDFKASAPNRLWLSDVTEFCLPSDSRVYLSAVLDCYDSSLVSWAISTSEKADELTNPSLEQAARKLDEGDACTIHTDKGGQYFSEGWIEICNSFSIERSMSRKGHSPDNARMEGFFGRLKMEFFDTRDWTEISEGAFIDELDAWLRYYNEQRAKQSLGWLSPMQYRRRFLRTA